MLMPIFAWFSTGVHAVWLGALQRCYMSIFLHVHGSTCVCASLCVMSIWILEGLSYFCSFLITEI